MKFSWKLLDYVLLGIAFNSAVCLFLPLSFPLFREMEEFSKITRLRKSKLFREKVRDIVGILNV